jgi:hypothetical protein
VFQGCSGPSTVIPQLALVPDGLRAWPNPARDAMPVQNSQEGWRMSMRYHDLVVLVLLFVAGGVGLSYADTPPMGLLMFLPGDTAIGTASDFRKAQVMGRD